MKRGRDAKFPARRRIFSLKVDLVQACNQALDDATCDKCGQMLILIGSLPPSGNKPLTRIYKCLPCHIAVAVPPIIALRDLV